MPVSKFLHAVERRLSYEQNQHWTKALIRELGGDALFLDFVLRRLNLQPTQIELLKDLLMERMLSSQDMMRTQATTRKMSGDEYRQAQQEIADSYHKKMLAILSPHQQRVFRSIQD